MLTRGWYARLCLVALALSSVTLSRATAQQGVWRSAAPTTEVSQSQPQPQRPPTVRGVSGNGVSLGRPVGEQSYTVATAGQTPRFLPPMFRHSSADSSRPGSAEPIAAVPPAGAVIAASAPVSRTATIQRPLQAAYEEPMEGDSFAIDRAQPRPRIPKVMSTEEVVVAPVTPTPMQNKPLNWGKTQPVYPPETVLPHKSALPDSLFEPEVPPARFYLTAEYLLWWTKDDQAPPLVTAGSATDPIPGALGQPGTIVLQNGTIDHGTRHGARFMAGIFLDDCGEKAFEIGGFFLGNRSSNFSANQPGQVIARPFFAVNPNLMMESVQLVQFPGQSLGRVDVRAPSNLWGLEANLSCLCCCGCDYRVNWFAGARYLNLRESLTISEAIQFGNDPAIQPPLFQNSLVFVQDRFETSNQFYGAQAGIEGRIQNGRWNFDGKAKLAAGVTHQKVVIDGFQTVTPIATGVPQQFVGGFLALNSNIGTFTRSRFSVAPEIGVGVGYWLTDCLRASVGYNFLYWTNVVRPGDQIDRNVDVLRIPNFVVPPGTVPASPPRPAVLFKDTDFWAHGVTFGLELRF